MSYVVQNFQLLHKRITPTPRFKFILIMNNMDLIFLFFKNNIFLYTTKNLNLFSVNFFFVFLKYFFSRQFLSFLNKSNFNLIGFYDNNQFKGAIYNIYNNLKTLIEKNSATVTLNVIPFEKAPVFNFYFFSVKIINTKINKKFYKNFFFYLMFFSSTFWYQHAAKFKFYLNFILVNSNLQVCPFYNGYFLHIYNL